MSDLQGTYSWAADLWSVGVITYILLSGFPPFWGSSDYMIFQRILENNVVSDSCNVFCEDPAIPFYQNCTLLE